MQRVYANGRLVYYKKAATADYWDSVWSHKETDQLYSEAQKGNLGYYEDIFPRYLPKKGRILEAGCGQGQIVLALTVLGYEAEGVDYAEKTIQFIKSKFPHLNVRVGDVTDLDVPDGHYAGYISIGVMEHNQNGPDAFLKEAHRILQPGGMAFISVPYLNILRRVKAKLGSYNGNRNHHGLEFYQYAYSKKEFSAYLEQFGFDEIATQQYGGYKGVKDELPMDGLFNLPQGWRLRKFLMHSKWVDHHVGHMMMYVARKR
jgi:SAM-dependent methyltransferase